MARLDLQVFETETGKVFAKTIWKNGLSWESVTFFVLLWLLFVLFRLFVVLVDFSLQPFLSEII